MEIKKLLEKNYLIFGFAFLGIVAILNQVVFSGTDPAEDELRVPQQSESVDTFIPKGYTLIPIDIANKDALSGLIGELGGVVDLYQIGQNNKKSFKIASKVKLIRAPLNNEQFAVLVPEIQNEKIMRYEGPFVAVVQNPRSAPETASSPVKSTQLQIEYGENNDGN